MFRIASVIILLCSFSSAHAIDYSIIYIKYPSKNPNGSYVTIPQGEQPYKIAAGADLMLLFPNKKEVTLVDCEKCSVMDPYISYDGKTVYYSLIEEANEKSASWLYKINISKTPYKPIRLTFDDGFDSNLYSKNISDKHSQRSKRSIRDMSPIPLSDGRLLFTSNRSALTALNPGPEAVIKSSVQQLYVMDDHDGSSTNAKLSNIHVLENGNLHMVQHPIQLMNGQILFSSWQDVAHKFTYSMTSLFTINPDGSNLKQFTEPHYYNKFLEHFITQLPNEDVVTGLYYPSYDYGYGVLLRYPLNPTEPHFFKNSAYESTRNLNVKNIGKRAFDRKGLANLTPHSTPRDIPSPNRSGKYSMPSIGKNGDLLVAYSKGYVNHFNAACNRKNQPNKCEHLKSGIYLIPNANKAIINDPSQLIKIKDDPNYNEIWPRAVLSYKELYTIDKPNVHLSDSNNFKEATAFVGTSSMYNREPLKGKNPDPFQSKSNNRELTEGNWTIQGSEAGVFSNPDIFGVRIVGTPAKPFTKPISKYGDKKRWQSIRPFLKDKRLDRVVARYGSFHGEKWEILGEFPLTYKHLKDPTGAPDTSWLAKIPAETPFLIQAIDKNGMTLNSELTWRALKPGEKRTDCGGCHAHSIEPVVYKKTASGMEIPINDKTKEYFWDLTQSKTPTIVNGEVKYIDKRVLDIEFRRDVYPIINTYCIECHSTHSSPPFLKQSPDDLYLYLKSGKNEVGKKYKLPQLSKYIRSPQARQSLLIWVIYNKRLDGRTNFTRSDDVDYPTNHPKLNIPESVKSKVAKWVDLGGPIDFLTTDGFGYTDDSQLPIIHLSNLELSNSLLTFSIGLIDAKSGVDLNTLEYKISSISNMDSSLFKENGSTFSFDEIDQHNIIVERDTTLLNVFNFTIKPLNTAKESQLLIEIKIKDKAGNKNILSKRIYCNNQHCD